MFGRPITMYTKNPLERGYFSRCMDSMVAKGIVLPTNPMTAMTIGFEDQSSEMSSMAMAAHKKLKKVNSDDGRARVLPHLL